MSEIASNQAKPKAPHAGPADKNAFVQVERWMALIRELSLEQVKS